MELTELLNATRYLMDNKYLDNVFPNKKSQKYRCKVCGNWETEQSDKKNICVDCREEYLERNGK